MYKKLSLILNQLSILSLIQKALKVIKGFTQKKYLSDNHKNNQQNCVDCLKPRSNKNERECKKCGCDHFYVPNC